MSMTELLPEDLLKSWISSHKSAAVAFSGGLDSSFILYKAAEILGAENVVAYTCINPHIFRYELTNALEIAMGIGVSWVPFTADIDYSKFNQENRCYFCKSAIMSEICHLAENAGLKAVFDGSVADDAQEHRPGRKALDELGIISPLAKCGISKLYIKNNLPEVLSRRAFIDQSCIATRFEGAFSQKTLMETEVLEDKIRKVYPDIRLIKKQKHFFLKFKKPIFIETEKVKTVQKILNIDII